MIRLDDAPKGYKDFDKGAAKKFVIDPHRMVAAKARGNCAHSRERLCALIAQRFFRNRAAA